jgi:hypothetical protein
MTKQILLTVTFAALAITGAAKSSGDLQCTLTGKRIAACCCTKAKDGKNLHCTLANKDIKECCCKSADKSK